jgi:voltage-gated potassium channel
MILCTIRWPRKIFRRHQWASLLILLAILFFCSVFAIYHSEKQQNPDLTLFDAFRIVLVFFLGEYGDEPKTFTGKVLSVVLFILGIVVVGAFIGKVASVFVELKMEVKMPKDMESHIVMCNWHDRGDRIIKELHSQLAAPETDIIVITEKDVNERELRLNPEYEKVFFIESDPTLHDVLKRARAHLATSVILLADDEFPDPDAKTALIALALAKLTKDLPKKPHVIAEVMNHHKIEHLLDAGIDEWVCSNDYGLGILAQSALYGKLSEVYQQLLTYSKDTNEIYMVDNKHYPQGFLGKGFTEITALLNANRNPANPAILLGVKRDNCVILNPKEDEFNVLKPGDSLIVIAFDPPDLTYLEK